MRFTKQAQLRKHYYNNTKKTETKFLWWPMKIDGETRWLETTTIEYRVDYEYNLFYEKHYYWKPFRFIDK